MALTQAERIEISKKIIDIPLQNAAFDNIKANLDANLIKITNEDNANKSLMDNNTAFIDPYQSELTQLDGNARTVLVEQDVVDGAQKIKQNYFFPNDNQVSLPNVPDGIWKFLAPFSGSIAIGKNYTEAFPTTGNIKEQDKIDTVNAQITIIEAAIAGTRSTGLECSEDASGSCAGETSPPQTTQITCEADGGVWTPSGGPDSYSPEAVIQQALIDIVAAVNDWKSFMLAEKALILTTDTDTGRQADNDSAIAEIDASVAVLDSWLLYDDWDTTTVLPSGSGGTACTAFAAMVAANFVASKLRAAELQEITDEITGREIVISNRITQLNTNLGSVGQDLSTGEINASGSGLYDNRYKAINVRLNLLGGSLNKKLGNARGQDAQDAQKATNASAAALYNSVMKVSIMKAPASNTGTIHVMDTADFAIGNTVYLVAEDQAELTGSILNISGNTVFLDFNVPAKYTHTNRSRLYKIL